MIKTFGGGRLMKYSDLLDILTHSAEKSFADFQRRLIFTQYEIMGVRTPILRKLAKEFSADFEDIFAFPNEYYEVVAMKLFQAANLPYEQFVYYLSDCVSWMDNWALCDGFKAKCIKQHREGFLPILQTMFDCGGEYEQRYPLVVLLTEYVEPSYLPKIVQFIEKADTSRYYVHMAVAWLLAEILVKEYEAGVALLKENVTDEKTHNKAIQKAIESYRLTNEQKEFLRSLKIRK
jgi:3-methyladenine DNA glycosylase AlkD